MAFRTTGFIQSVEKGDYTFVDYDEPAKVRTTRQEPFIIPPELRRKTQKKGPELSLFDRWTSSMNQQIDSYYDNETARLQRVFPRRPDSPSLNREDKQRLGPEQVTEVYDKYIMADDQWQYQHQAAFEQLESQREKDKLGIRKQALNKALALEKAMLTPKKAGNDFQAHKDAGESIKLATQMYEADAIPFVRHQASFFRSREYEAENFPLVIDEEMSVGQDPEYLEFGRAMANLWNLYYHQSGSTLSEIYTASQQFRAAYTNWQRAENIKSTSRTQQEDMQLPMDAMSLILGR